MLQFAPEWITGKWCNYLDVGGPFPLPDITSSSFVDSLIDSVDRYIQLKSDYDQRSTKFLRFLTTHFAIETPNRKIQNWSDLAFLDFIKEIKKHLVTKGDEKLDKKQDLEWMDIFEENRNVLTSLQNGISDVNNEINEYVYKLYGFDDNEIAIIESE